MDKPWAFLQEMSTMPEAADEAEDANIPKAGKLKPGKGKDCVLQ